jgi:hypothetical protein
LAALRAAASRENLDSAGGGSNANSPTGNSPSGSPSFLSKQVSTYIMYFELNFHFKFSL